MTNDIDILSLNTEEMWNLYKREVDMNSAEFDIVRKGINISFDIINYFQGFNIRVKEKQGYVIINGKSVRKEEVDTELIARERIMAKYLLEVFGKTSIASVRSKR